MRNLKLWLETQLSVGNIWRENKLNKSLSSSAWTQLQMKLQMEQNSEIMQ